MKSSGKPDDCRICQYARWGVFVCALALAISVMANWLVV